MVMVKQPDGIKRARKATDTVAGKLVTTEYTITGEPPLTAEKTELGWTKRVDHGSVSWWESHPAFGPDGRPHDPAEYPDHTNAVLEIIQSYRESGAQVAVTPAPAQPSAAKAKGEPAKPAVTPKAKAPAKGKSRASAKPARNKPESAAVLDAAQTEKAARAGTTTRGRRKAGAKAVAAAAAPDPTAGTPSAPPEDTSASSPESVSVAAAAPQLEPTELIPVGPEHAAALDDGSSSAGPESATALEAPADGWGSGYPEPKPAGKHRLDSPFQPDPETNPFARPDESAGGFVR
jgi:hypothetical protein